MVWLNENHFGWESNRHPGFETFLAWVEKIYAGHWFKGERIGAVAPPPLSDLHTLTLSRVLFHHQAAACFHQLTLLLKRRCEGVCLFLSKRCIYICRHSYRFSTFHAIAAVFFLQHVLVCVWVFAWLCEPVRKCAWADVISPQLLSTCLWRWLDRNMLAAKLWRPFIRKRTLSSLELKAGFFCSEWVKSEHAHRVTKWRTQDMNGLRLRWMYGKLTELAWLVSCSGATQPSSCRWRW